MTTQAERQKAYRERMRATGKRGRLYFVTDDQDRIIWEFLAKGSNPKHDSVSPGPGAAMVETRDKLSAIRQRMEAAEKRYRDKEGNSFRFWGIWQKLGEKMEKFQKENHKEVQDLIMLLARRAGKKTKKEPV